MDCVVHGVAKSWTRLSTFHFLQLTVQGLLHGRQRLRQGGLEPVYGRWLHGFW